MRYTTPARSSDTSMAPSGIMSKSCGAPSARCRSASRPLGSAHATPFRRRRHDGRARSGPVGCDGVDRLERIVEQALADRPASLRRGLKVFLRLIDWIAVVRYARRFSALDAARRARLLAFIERAPLLLVRRGFWGLRTLGFMGYYGRPAAATEIGYRADPRA